VQLTSQRLGTGPAAAASFAPTRPCRCRLPLRSTLVKIHCDSLMGEFRHVDYPEVRRGFSLGRVLGLFEVGGLNLGPHLCLDLRP